MSQDFLSGRALTFTPSVIQETSRLAEKCGAINLAEGFPDFPAPPLVKEAATRAIKADCNQYRHVPRLCELIAERFAARHASASPPIEVDPATEVVITCGQTEAMAAAVLAVINPGDEVVLFNPSFETYPANVAMAGGSARYVNLHPPEWSFQEEELLTAIGPRCKAIVVNSPHNPTGKVFTDTELAMIARVCTSKNLLALTDEVYEDLTYDGTAHRSLSSFPGMRNRTVVTSSLSKTFSVTGWRIGWAITPPQIAAALSNLHVKLTDSAPAPFQEAAVTALHSSASYYRQLREDYQERRDMVCVALEKAGFEIGPRPQGGYFVFARIPQRFRQASDDVAFVSRLIQEAGVAVVPGSIFFYDLAPGSAGPESCNRATTSGTVDCLEYNRSTNPCSPCLKHANGQKFDQMPFCTSKEYIRVAICKKNETLRAAIESLATFLQTPEELQ